MTNKLSVVVLREIELTKFFHHWSGVVLLLGALLSLAWLGTLIWLVLRFSHLA